MVTMIRSCAASHASSNQEMAATASCSASASVLAVIVEILLPVVQRYARDSGCGVLIVEQHIQLALEVADRGYVLSHGEIVLHDRAEVLHADRELVISSYLGEQQVPIGESAELSEGKK